MLALGLAWLAARSRSVAWGLPGTLASTGTIAVALGAELLRVEAWQQGGMDVVWVTWAAAVAVGLAVAARRSTAASLRFGALAALSVMWGISCATWWLGSSVLEEAVHRASARDAEVILALGRAELWTAPHLAALLTLGVATILLVPIRPRSAPAAA